MLPALSTLPQGPFVNQQSYNWSIESFDHVHKVKREKMYVRCIANIRSIKEIDKIKGTKERNDTDIEFSH